MRARLAREALATLFFFVAVIATPRAGFIVHRHGGGEHQHVHLDGGAPATGDAEIDRLLADALGHGHHHHHQPHLPGGQASLEQADAAHSLHWHSQSPFQRAITASVSPGLGLVFLAPTLVLDPHAPAAAPSTLTKARAPPLV